MVKNNRFWLAMVLLLASAFSQARITVKLIPDEVYVGDPVKLLIQSDQGSDKPDFSVLEKDFDLSSTSKSSNISIINGDYSSTTTWTVTLLPKVKGDVTIPSIPVGNETTQSLLLRVTDVPASVAAELKQRLTIETTIPDGTYYVQQKIPYTVKLIADSSIQSGDINPPQITDVLIEKIAEDKRYSIERGGKKYTVIEQQYLMSPEKSGDLLIPPSVFHGQQKIASKQQRSRQSLFPDDMFTRRFFQDTFREPTKPITVYSDSHNLKIETIPTNYTGKHWLPAEQLVVEDSWTEQFPEFKVGEPVTRTLKIIAKGLSASQIPGLVMDVPDGFRVYQDNKKVETRTDGKTVYGIVKQEMSYVAQQAGKRVIPSVKIDWWDTPGNKQQQFAIPKYEVQVEKGALATSPAQSETLAGNDSKQESVEPEPVSDIKNNALYYSLFIMLFVALIALIWWYFQREKLMGKADHLNKEKSHWRAFAQACENNDARLAAAELLTLARYQWPQYPPENLQDLANEVALGKDALLSLDRALYAESKTPWRGDELLSVFRSGFPMKNQHEDVVVSALPALYP